MPSQLYSRAADLLEAELGNELVALDPAAGNCFGFNEVATSVWHSLEQPKTFDELKFELMNDYQVEPDECAADLHQLLDSLIDKGLIRIER